MGRVADALCIAVFAVPSTIVGVGLIGLWNRPGVLGAIYGTDAMFTLGYLARFVPVATLVIAAATASVLVFAEIARAWGLSDPAAALKWVGALPAGLDKDAVFGIVVLNWAARSPAAAAEYSLALPAGALRAAALTNTASAWPATDPEGALKFAEDLLTDRFFMLNGDVLTDIDLTAQLEQHERTGARLTLALYPVARKRLERRLCFESPADCPPRRPFPAAHPFKPAAD